MSDNKKYYYLKLKDNFFDSPEIKVLEAMPNGYKYSNLLLKLYLKSLRFEGALRLNEYIPYNTEMIAAVVGMDIDTVKVAFDIFKQLKLVEILEDGTIYMLDIQNFIGLSSTEADRKREYRSRIEAEKNKNLLSDGQMSRQTSGQMSDKTPPEIEIDIEKEKEIEYIDLTFVDSIIDAVKLTQKQYDNLIKDYGVNEVHKKIISLDYYITEKNKTYKDHNKTIRNWFNKEGVEKGKYKEVKTEQRYVRRNSAIPNFDD